ncbi:MAG TPA: M48 family metallopeptidase [Gemmatimonadaceae bacterium]|nr:M48 family metallopeptidase [Gemmatimonadaceae bacterium]
MRRNILVVGAVAVLAACGVSTQQEVEMGQSYSQQINAQLPIISDPEINRYVNVLGDSIARLSDERNLDWRFYVVDSRDVNAFAVPGGFIYINRGLIERAQNLSMLAGVLGHEIGHVIERHSVQQMEKMQQAQIGVTLACVLTRVCENQAAGALIDVAGTAVFAKFSRDDEREADRDAITYVTRAGIDPRGIPAMFRVLLSERNRQSSAVDSWFSTHPLEEDRIAETEGLIKQIDEAIIETLTTDTQNYQEFRRRVQALPPPPAMPRS